MYGYTHTHCTGGWMGLGTDMYGFEKCRPHRRPKPIPFSLANPYTDYATQAAGIGKCK